MAHWDRWAAVFVKSTEKDTEAGLACLKALVQPLRAVPGMFGYSAARRLEEILRTICSGAIYGGDTIEYTIRFIVLLVEKDRLRNIDAILQKIEDQIDMKNGVLAVTLESTIPPDGDFEDKLRRNIIAWTGATAIKMKTRLVPDLLGGYRLRIGGFYVDASLKGRIEKMKSDLEGGM